MNPYISFVDPIRLLSLITSIDASADSDNDLVEEINQLQQLIATANIINEHRNVEIKYRYPYPTAFNNKSKVEPILIEEIQSAGVSNDCWAYKQLQIPRD